MKITILGATGNAGSRVVAEALSRGHEVTAVVRNSTRSNDLPAAVRPRNPFRDCVVWLSRQFEFRALHNYPHV